MKVATLYDVTNKISNNKVSSLVYKINKVIVNVLYPRTVKLGVGIDDDSDVIVSLTSFPQRINTVWITISTILNQTVKPKKIILWLAIDQFPNREKGLPNNLLRLKQYGLEIRFCDNLYPHKKYYYSMLENPNNTIVTVDDDVFYPEYFLSDLIQTSHKYPGVICCTWAHKIKVSPQEGIYAYDEWDHGVNDCKKPNLLIMPVGIGGVLYPPRSLDNRIFDKNNIEELCLKTDDLWLKSMAVLKKTAAMRIPKVYKRTYFTIMCTQKKGLLYENMLKNNNDVAMKKILQKYPEIVNILLED